MGTESPSCVESDPGWAEMEDVSQHVAVLSEKTLRQIAKGPLAKFTLSCQDDEKVARVWRSLLETYSTPSISHSHMTAAGNAVSAFLDCGINSRYEATRRLALSRQTWLAVFEVYMNRFDEAKSKSMMQVLYSLVNILKHDEADMQPIRSQAIDATIGSLILRGSRSQLKASMLCIEVLMRKNVIRPTEFIALTEDWLAQNVQKWTHLLQEDCKALSVDVSQVSAKPRDKNSHAWAVEAAGKIFVLGLVSWGRHLDFASAAGSALGAFFQSIQISSHEGNTQAQILAPTWVAPVRHVMLQNMGALETMSNQILYPLCKVDPSGFKCFMNTLPLKNVVTGDMTDATLPELCLLFSALQIAKKIGVVHEDYFLVKPSSLTAEPDDSLVLKSEILGQFLLHRESSIRLAALSLLVTAPSTSKPLTSAAAWAIVRGLPSMHAESDAYSRGEILSLTRKFINRVKGGVLEDQSGFSQVMKLGEDAETRALSNAYVLFLKTDLRPGVSYPRHITALKALLIVLESGLDPRISGIYPRNQPGENSQCKLSIEIFHPSLLRLLVDLLLDPYDDVRSTSLAILKMFPWEILMSGLVRTNCQSSCPPPRLTDALSRAEQLASNTSRADHADAVARLYHILFNAAASDRSEKPEIERWETKVGVADTILRKLEEKLSLPGGLFTSSMRDAPLHGFLSALRYIVMVPNFYSSISGQPSTSYSHWRAFHDRISSICDMIWHEVKPVLCVDSPEGHSDEPAEDLAVGPKDILSYSWRALRESSLLLHATLSNATYGPKGENGLNRADYERIGTLSFIQLAELRHRGAFSTVAQTFATCCQRCGQSKDPSISTLPEAWYEEVRKLIFAAASKLTRRSAGMPALVTGILSSQPGGPLFDRVMNDLLEVSSLPEQHDKAIQEVELPQVHAMNCLKDIFPSNKMGAHSEPFVMRSLTISSERLGSPVWALRNSGLMLFRALMTRMFRLISGARLGFGGETGAEPGARISFEKYPGLVQLLSNLLSPPEISDKTEGPSSSSDIVTERVFPALELIGEKVPMPQNDDDLLLRRLVLCQLQSSVWGIREHAARVYASLLNASDILQGIQGLLNFDQENETQNSLHGRALGVRYALRRHAFASQTKWNECVHDIFSTVRTTFASMLPSAHSPFVATVLIEIVNEVVERSIEAGAEETISPFLKETFDLYDLNGILDCIFDLSDPSWRFSSTSRAASLLRREVSWCEILQKFTSNRLHDLVNFFQNVSDFDSDAARWLLQRISNTFGRRDQYMSSFINLCSSVILGRHSQDVKWTAIENLANILESVLDVNRSGTEAIDLPCEALERQLKADADVQMRSREMADAELRLQGCLLSLRAASMQSPPASAFEKDIRKWTVKIQFAMQEETEFTTRHAAAMSLATFARILRPADGVTRTDDVFLDIYLSIYDMLNDDDEEIRDVTASTASWVLSYSSVSPGKAVALDCLNAGELLTVFISQNYSSSRPLCGKILQYITGQKPRVSGHVSREKLIPVSGLISELRKESTILFVEEKQNLFIDEDREQDLWTKSLFHLAESAYDGSSVTEVCRWVSEGLSYLCGLADGNIELDGPLGWTSKPEIFTLGVRVINIAIALSSKDFPASKLVGLQQQDILREGLKSLAYRGRGAALHPEWLSRAQAV